MFKSIAAGFVLVVLCCTTGTPLAPTCSDSSVIGKTYVLNVSQSSPASICIQLNNSMEVVRVFAESQNATSRHPVLVTVRQSRGVVSWALPYVESGFAFSSVERTLCPLLNEDESGSSALVVDFSTTYPTPLLVTFKTTLVYPFKLELNEPLMLEASPSGPSYLMYEYEYPPSNTRVRVNFRSEDSTSDICAIASIQTAFCPVVELLDNPDHRGKYQTMRSIASITTRENDTEPHFGFFYVVLTVFPNDGRDNSCVYTEQGLGDELILLDNAVDNFNPTVYSGPNRNKRVNITIELVSPQLAAAIVVPTVVYLLFVVLAVTWILVTEVWRRSKKRRHKSRQTKETSVQLGEVPVVSENSQDKQEHEQSTTDHPDTASNCESASNGEGTKHASNGDRNGSTEHGESGLSPTINTGSNISAAQEEGRGAERTVYTKLQVNVRLSELGEIDDSPAVQREYYDYCFYLLVIIVFYSIPAYQLVVTYQKVLSVSGNEDICYYNSLCAHPLDINTGLTLSAFNKIFSNIGYFILGALFILVAFVRRLLYRSQEKYNIASKHIDKKGVPQAFGIYYAIGLVMIAQAFMSIAYHLCPNSTNYQFDATFMFVMITLGTYKVLKTRCPDLAPLLYRHALFLMIIIVVVVLGELWFRHVAYRVVFIIVYLVTTVVFCVMLYYRWQIKLASINVIYKMHRQNKICPPQHIPKLIVILIVLLVNTIIAGGIFLTDTIGVDFTRYILLIVLVNFLIYLAYYGIAKLVYREYCTFKPVLYLALAVITWIAAFYFFTRNVINWSMSPALSRDMNAECLLFNFYDSHDLWHFLSAFALFFSFAIILTLDDRQDDMRRSKLRAF